MSVLTPPTHLENMKTDIIVYFLENYQAIATIQNRGVMAKQVRYQNRQLAHPFLTNILLPENHNSTMFLFFDDIMFSVADIGTSTCMYPT